MYPSDDDILWGIQALARESHTAPAITQEGNPF